MTPLRLSTFALTVLVCSTPLAWGKPPNVVMIISDDQMWTDYGFMGHSHIETPNIDRLAAESLTFTRGYVPDSLCRPSLATLISGLYPHQHGIVGNDPPYPPSVKSLPPRRRRGHPDYLAVREKYIEHIDRAPALPRLLGKKGYLSHQSGKWWEGNFSRAGFTHGMTHGDRRRGGRHGDLGLKIGREGLQPVFQFIDEAARKDRPFFIWYAPFLPHTPHNPPKRLFDKYKTKTDSQFIAKYWAMCEWFDETVGDLMAHLDKKSLREDTIVLYVTDNGWINQAGSSRYAPKSKRSQYDGGIRTPIMVNWKGKVAPRLDKKTLVNSIDLAPTVLAAAGLDRDERMRGLNLLDEKKLAARRRIFGEILEHDIRHMTDPVASLRQRWVIEDRWKLIVPHKPVVADGVVELYDLDADPHETRNLAEKQPELVTRLSMAIRQWWPAKPAE